MKSTQITIFESGNIGTFVRDQSACIENGLCERDSGLILGDLNADFCPGLVSLDIYHCESVSLAVA